MADDVVENFIAKHARTPADRERLLRTLHRMENDPDFKAWVLGLEHLTNAFIAATSGDPTKMTSEGKAAFVGEFYPGGTAGWRADHPPPPRKRA